MIKLSEHGIDEIMAIARAAWNNTDDWKGKYKKKYFFEEFKGLLRMKSSGQKENVCPHCLGSGYRGEGK